VAAKTAKKKAQRYADLVASCDTGETMVRVRPRHMKLQGFSGAGKSTFAIKHFSNLSKGMKPEECLMTVIDCDLEGQADLVAREDILPLDLRSRFFRRVCRNPEEVNDMVLAFIDLHRQHAEDYPEGVRVMLFENEGAYYLSCRDHYSQEVHGKSEGELLLARQQQAVAEGKKTLPAFAEGQMHSYKVINKLFFQPYERLKIGGELYGYHFLSTVLLRQYTQDFGTAQEKQVVSAAGRPDQTDPLFDWIVEFAQQQRTKGGETQVRHTAHVKKSRACSPFKIENPTPERFWDAATKQGMA